MRRAPQPRVILEMALIRLTEIRHVQTVEEILDRLVTLEGRLSGGHVGPATTGELPLFGARPVPAGGPARTAQGPDASSPSLGPPRRLQRRTGPRTSPSLGGCRGPPARAQAAGLGPDRGGARRLTADTLTLEVRNGNAFVRDTLEDPDTRQVIAAAATEAFGRRLRMDFRFTTPRRPGWSRWRSVVRPQPHPGRDHPLVREA